MSSKNFCTKARKRKTLVPLFYLCAQSCEVDEVDFDLLKLRPQIVQQNFQSGEVFLHMLLKGTEVVSYSEEAPMITTQIHVDSNKIRAYKEPQRRSFKCNILPLSLSLFQAKKCVDPTEVETATDYSPLFHTEERLSPI